MDKCHRNDKSKFKKSFVVVFFFLLLFLVKEEPKVFRNKRRDSSE